MNADYYLDDVPEAKSYLSTHATFKPRVAASNAAPEPVALPPIISTSNSSLAFSLDMISTLEGINVVSVTGWAALLLEFKKAYRSRGGLRRGDRISSRRCMVFLASCRKEKEEAGSRDVPRSTFTPIRGSLF